MDAHITVFSFVEANASRTHEGTIDIYFDGPKLRIFLGIDKAKELIEKMHKAMYQEFQEDNEPSIAVKVKKDKQTTA